MRTLGPFCEPPKDRPWAFQMSYLARRNMNNKLKKALTAPWHWEPSLFHGAAHRACSPEMRRSLLLLPVPGTSTALTPGGAADSPLLRAGWLASATDPQTITVLLFTSLKSCRVSSYRSQWEPGNGLNTSLYPQTLFTELFPTRNRKIIQANDFSQ